jgi:hypothetical protein
MKFKLGLAFLLLFSASAVFAQDIEPIQKVTLPLEVRQELVSSYVPPEIEGKVWNRWTSENFTVLSLNDIQAQYLHKHLELVKVWVFNRWGLYDVDFSVECKMICVDDPDLFYKMFKLKNSYVDIRRNDDGSLRETIIFLLVNDAPSHTVPVPLTEVCLTEFSTKYEKNNFPWWVYRGMSVLNGSLDQIRLSLNEFAPYVEQSKPVYFSEGLFKMTKDSYKKLDDEQKRLFDQSAMLFCLMIRKEFGQNKFHHVVNVAADDSGEAALMQILGFRDKDDFDRTFRRYMIDLVNDIEADRTPDSYLQIRAKEGED